MWYLDEDDMPSDTPQKLLGYPQDPRLSFDVALHDQSKSVRLRMVHGRILILPIRPIQYNMSTNRLILKPNPSLNLLFHSLFMEQNLTTATGPATITSVSSVPTKAHVQTIA